MIHIIAADIAGWSTLALQDSPVQGVLGAEGGQPGTAQNGAAGAAGTTAPAPGGFNFIMPFIMLMVVFLFLSTILGGRKEKKRRAAMLDGIQKRDRVQTVGGVIGHIIEIKGDEFLLESDRASNTRMWITRSSVSNVLRSANAPASANAETTPEKSTEAASA
jgi:preprotein translocase YajC subunit|tara:strand:+ start:597 stop:1082 length:486 start_codon:yes stop_codon:yes gene_type:complete